ncbi:MAG: phosphate acetyltransferase, partial [Candidatus Marinimicrobia bacterium]|nr:phosphate acetyltransferase [Candidatus Neomarinimicrobiota bacterium]
MSKILSDIRQNARKNSNIKLVLPEGYDPRVVEAARNIVDEGIARVVLLGGQIEISEAADQAGVSLDGIECFQAQKSPDYEAYADSYFELRKAKGMTREKALEILKDPTFFAAMMLRENNADACISGAANATAHVVRAALQIVKTKEGSSVLSSDFLMIAPDDSRALSFADCAVMPDPDSAQLADIAYDTAQTHKAIFGVEAKVAMLSFSTKGSAAHAMVSKVSRALAIAREKYPDLTIDGELQLDAALIEKVAKSKAPGSNVAGQANVLVFPDLNSGNIGYKLTQRLAGYAAVGPVFQGLNKPIHDLSRGCSAEDIVNLAAIAALQTVNF